MKNLMKICKKILFPPGWLMVILTVFSMAVLTAVFLKGEKDNLAAYTAYFISAYTFVIVCIFFAGTLPQYYRGSKQKLSANPWGNRYLNDAAFKTQISLYINLGINVLYSAFTLAAGIYNASFWWGAVAVYYILLSVIRFLLLSFMRNMSSKQDMIAEYRRYRLCGLLMLVLNLSLIVIVTQMVQDNKAHAYSEIMVLTAATFTFYTVTVSVWDLIRSRKHKSPVLSAAKNLRFAAALVSLLSLEAAMLAQYGDDEAFYYQMTGSSGTIVCIIVLAMSVYMIIKANRAIDRLKNDP